MAGLEGKVALISGGGGGIGAAIGEAYAAAGAGIAITGRRSEPLARVAQRIAGAGGDAVGVFADVTDLDAMRDAVGEVLDHFGRLDIVVANAGVQPEHRPVLEYSTEQWREVLNINLTGVWNTAKAAVAALVAAGGGSIIVIGSGMARATTGGPGAYSVSQAGVSTLTRVLSVELRSSNIAVNELIPGPTRTAGMGIDGTAHDREIEQRWSEMGEWFKEPEGVAQLALFVAALPPHGTTGQVFSLAGRLL